MFSVDNELNNGSLLGCDSWLEVMLGHDQLW